MKVLPFVDNVLVEFLKLKYPKTHIVAINCMELSFEGEQWVEKFVKENNIDMVDVLVSELILLECRTLDEALDFCNSVPDSNPYCFVFSDGNIVHENT